MLREIADASAAARAARAPGHAVTFTGTMLQRRDIPGPEGAHPRPAARRWAWRTVASPWPNGPRRVPHPLADRLGQPVREVCRGRNGNVLLEFEDGSWTIAPWRAAR